MAERRLEGKIALVTGAGGGIGAGIAKVLARHGARVYASDVDAAASVRTAEAIQAGGGDACDLRLDVTKGQDITAAFRRIEEEDGRLDVVVSNAGLNVRSDFRHLSDRDWVTIREVNLDGVVRIARDAFDLMRASGNASLINVASIMGHRGLRQLAGYSATKGAVAALTRALAVEYAPYGIRVNTVSPGFVETALTERVLRNPMISKALVDQTPLRRFGTPEDVANVALFLASDEARFVTGAEIAVDGGMSAAL
jgi:NAD(P)-dependent dehydrogenase (short-subunit alcohol dehydrogenase family)